MANFVSKYDVGDVVFYPWVQQSQKRAPCPDCLDTRTWQAVSPGGIGYLFACPRCRSHQSNPDLRLTYNEYSAHVKRLTVGKITLEADYDDESRGSIFKYMCHETGFPSGSVYKETDFYATQEEAMKQAEILRASREVEMIKDGQKYHGHFEVYDYQILPATVGTLEAAIRSLNSKFENFGNDFADKVCGEMDTTKDIVEFVHGWLVQNKFPFTDFDPNFAKFLERLLKKKKEKIDIPF